jgi:hypothetical protein
VDNNGEYKGISGWLILIAIGIIFGPIKMVTTTVLTFQPIFEDGTWEMLTTLGSDVYDPLWGPLITGELTYNIVMIIASLYLAYLFFTKHHRFPLVYILLLTIPLIIIPLDAWLIKLVLPDEPIFDPETVKELVRTILATFIWVPYMLVSKRVEATFVRKEASNDTQLAADALN